MLNLRCFVYVICFGVCFEKFEFNRLMRFCYLDLCMCVLIEEWNNELN